MHQISNAVRLLNTEGDGSLRPATKSGQRKGLMKDWRRVETSAVYGQYIASGK